MKYKFLIQKNEKKDELIIREMSELEKGSFALTYEETFKMVDISDAVELGDASLIQAIRTKRFFHNITSSQVIVSGIKTLLSDNNKDSLEVAFDDFDDIVVEVMEVEEVEDEDVKLDDLLDDKKGVEEDPAQDKTPDDKKDIELDDILDDKTDE